jgi:8-oxo-dGTP diphosphatase
MSPSSSSSSSPEYPRALVAVDVAAFTVLENDLKLLLIHRGLPPQEPSLALPGGFVRCGDGATDQGEDLEAAARRELVEETRLGAHDLFGRVRLVQVGAFGAPDRDPRARVISVAWLALVRPELAAFVRAGSDARDVLWCSVAALPGLRLAFDHDAIVASCLQRLRRDVDATDVARELVGQVFTVAELRAVVDAVAGAASDPANFRRRFARLVEDGVVVAAPGRRVTGRRQAAVFRFA